MNAVRDNPAQHRFELAIEGSEEPAAAYYQIDGDRVTLTHTEVPQPFSGLVSGRSWHAGFSTRSARAVARPFFAAGLWAASMPVTPNIRTSSMANGGHSVRSLVANSSAFPIMNRWAARQPERLQLYSVNTPNGVKVSIMLEEIGLPYEAHWVSFDSDDHKTPEFLSVNPNGKIPAIIDPDGPDGQPLTLFESGAILLYLADKTGKLIGETATDRWHAMQWVMFQMGSVGPMMGQLGFFSVAGGKDWEDKRPRERYANESRRLLEVLDQTLDGQDWILRSGYSVADIALVGWINALMESGLGEQIGADEYRNLAAWLTRARARPAVQRGLKIPVPPS